MDKKNSSLICVATVADTMGDKILVHFDGWDNNYDYWCDVTSPFIHPVGYCDTNGYELSPPCSKYTDKNPKNSDTRKIAVIILKFEQCGSVVEY